MVSGTSSSTTETTARFLRMERVHFERPSAMVLFTKTDLKDEATPFSLSQSVLLEPAREIIVIGSLQKKGTCGHWRDSDMAMDHLAYPNEQPMSALKTTIGGSSPRRSPRF